MTKPNREVELKLEFARDDRAAILRAAPLSADDARTRSLVSTYFDTPERAVHDHGYTLRIRRHDGQRTQTIKREQSHGAGLFARAEWEHSVPDDTPLLDAGSGPLARALAGLAGDARALAPVFVNAVERTALRLTWEGADIELAIDCGTTRTAERTEDLAELELELLDGPPRALFDLARLIDGRVPLRLGVRSKAERGYALLGPATSGSVKARAAALEPEMAVGDAFRAIVQACLHHYRRNEALLLDTYDPEALHQARVALRRLRSAIALFRPLLRHDVRTDPLDASLRAFLGALGEARDLDVLTERVGADVRETVAEARDRARSHALCELRSARPRLLLLDFVEWLTIGDWAAADRTAIEAPVAGFATEVLANAHKGLAHAGRGFAKLDARHLHKLRIKAKKARYAAEFFAPLWETSPRRRQTKSWIARIKKLQDHLGEINDHAVGTRILAELGVQAPLPGGSERHRASLRAKAGAAFETLMELPAFWQV